MHDHSFLLTYNRRFLGRDLTCRGHYVSFDYNPMRDEYRAIVRPATALGHHAIKLGDIANIRAFADWLERRCRQDRAAQGFASLASEISLPTGTAPKTCQLTGIGPV